MNKRVTDACFDFAIWGMLACCCFALYAAGCAGRGIAGTPRPAAAGYG